MHANVMFRGLSIQYNIRIHFLFVAGMYHEIWPVNVVSPNVIPVLCVMWPNLWFRQPVRSIAPANASLIAQFWCSSPFLLFHCVWFHIWKRPPCPPFSNVFCGSPALLLGVALSPISCLLPTWLFVVVGSAAA